MLDGSAHFLWDDSQLGRHEYGQASSLVPAREVVVSGVALSELLRGPRCRLRTQSFLRLSSNHGTTYFVIGPLIAQHVPGYCAAAHLSIVGTMARNGSNTEKGFHVFAMQAANWVGNKWAFLAALLVIALWLVSWAVLPLFGHVAAHH